MRNDEEFTGYRTKGVFSEAAAVRGDGEWASGVGEAEGSPAPAESRRRGAKKRGGRRRGTESDEEQMSATLELIATL